VPDVTHRRARDRAPPPALAERFGSRPGYLVVDRPLAAEWATAGRRAHAEDGKGRALIQWHAERFAGGEAEIPSGDGGRAIFLDTGHGEAGPPQALVVPFDAAPRERARPVRIADAPARGVDRPRSRHGNRKGGPSRRPRCRGPPPGSKWASGEAPPDGRLKLRANPGTLG
jgi:hypothetical protein